MLLSKEAVGAAGYRCFQAKHSTKRIESMFLQKSVAADTLPKANSSPPKKWWCPIGISELPGGGPIFKGKLLVFREPVLINFGVVLYRVRE